VSAHDQIDLLAQVGITVLLFLVGLKLDLQHVRHIGPWRWPRGSGSWRSRSYRLRAILLLLGKDWVTASMSLSLSHLEHDHHHQALSRQA
jgi:hypothetical protein